MGEYRELQKMKNSGNEAKKYLKTKHITFLNGANYAQFTHKLAQMEPEMSKNRAICANEPKLPRRGK
jgi:hypothetical protein